MRTVPHAAPAYLGSVLLSAHTAPSPHAKDRRPAGVESTGAGAGGGAGAGALPPLPLPPRAAFCLRATVFAGSDLPRLGQWRQRHAHGSGSGELRQLGVLVTLGSVGVATARCAPSASAAEAAWNQFLEARVELPGGADAEHQRHMPDVIVYLLSGAPEGCPCLSIAPQGAAGAGAGAGAGAVAAPPPSGAAGDFMPIAFARVPAAELLAAGPLGLPPQWLALREDTAVNALPDSEPAGLLLLRLGLTPAPPLPPPHAAAAATGSANAHSPAADSEVLEDWLAQAAGARERVAYELRCHVYRGRGLPGAQRRLH
jgi:hypothetical protein